MTARPLYQPGEPVWDMTENPRCADVVVAPKFVSGLELVITRDDSIGLPARGWWYRLECKAPWLVHESALRRRPPPAERSISEILANPESEPA